MALSVHPVHLVFFSPLKEETLELTLAGKFKRIEVFLLTLAFCFSILLYVTCQRKLESNKQKKSSFDLAFLFV